MNARALTPVAERQTRSARLGLLMLVSATLVLAQAIATNARGMPESFADLAEKVSPAVVNITTSTNVAGVSGPQPIVPEGSPLEDFFRDFMDRQNPDGGDRPRRRNNALGSGFVISEDGYIVTNNHVIDQADSISIEFFSGEELDAVVVGTDRNTDLALLKVESDVPLPYVSFGDSDIMRVGDWVMAVGNPLGQGFSVSAGIVSARERALSGTYDDFIQTDAAINRGNSGGPLFNLEGEVIGINTAILSPNGGSIGIGFAMSSAVADRVIGQLQQFGETRRGWLGVRIQDVTGDVADALGLEAVAGALVTDVPDGPSADAGIEAGDVILTFDGREIEDTRELVRAVGNTEVGKRVRVVVFREGATQTIMVTLARREDAERAVPASAEPPKSIEPETSDILGVTVSELTDTLREELTLGNSASGLVIMDVAGDSEAFDKGLRAGDLIAEAGQQAISTPGELEALVQSARDAGRKSILLLVRREGQPRFVALTIG